MQVAKEFRTWVQDIKAPEEFFYATLARIDQTSAENPGRFSVVQGMVIRGCQIDMQGLQLCAKPRHFCKLDVATSRMAFLDLNLHVLQLATSNSNN